MNTSKAIDEIFTAVAIARCIRPRLFEVGLLNGQDQKDMAGQDAARLAEAIVRQLETVAAALGDEPTEISGASTPDEQATGLPGPRRLEIAIDATIQLEPLLGLILDAAGGYAEEPLIGSLTIRARQLNAIVMSVITGDELRDTKEMEALVLGAPREERDRDDA